eukprot:15366664-Ditylum_brightwellii.AAC.2
MLLPSFSYSQPAVTIMQEDAESLKKDKSFTKLFDNLKQDGSIVVVPTDKANNYVAVTVKKFHSWVLGHLSENAEELDQKMIINIHRKDELYAAKLKPMLAKGGVDFLNEGIASKATPQPPLLVKGHKDREENGDYPTHLVIPATDCMAMFLKIDYLGIKKMLDNNKVNCMTCTIIQALDLKEKLETMRLKKDEVIVMSLDIKNMYPPVQL